MRFVGLLRQTQVRTLWSFLSWSFQLRSLQTELSSCKEELSHYLQQMEEVKKHHERQLELKNSEVSPWSWALPFPVLLGNPIWMTVSDSCWLMYHLVMYVYQLSQLQEDLRRKCVAYQSSSEENLQLQHSMQNQHTMLQESTSRIAQLEESQSQLQSQVHTHTRVPMAVENPEISRNFKTVF